MWYFVRKKVNVMYISLVEANQMTYHEGLDPIQKTSLNFK